MNAIRTATMTTDGEFVPEEIRDAELWVLWNGESKIPVAPWANGHLWWASWGSDLPAEERPETDYAEAARYADIGIDALLADYWIPPNEPAHERLGPTIILPPTGLRDDHTARLMYIDFDDVRDPETEEVSPEVAELVERLDSYTEISSSGTGLHVLVYAELPPGVGMVNEDLDVQGSIEMYDHARFFAGTWHHVEGTPRTINHRQEVVEDLVETYAADRLEEGPDTAGGRLTRSTSTSASNEEWSPYFDVDLAGFADPDPIERSYGGEKQGAHPHHGKTTAGERSTNYKLDTGDNCWHCFAHNSGGGPLEMAAIMAGELRCRDAGQGALGGLSDEAFLRTCLYARDTLGGYTEDMDPPYRALVGVAQKHDLPMADTEKQVLGQVTHKIARAIYDELGAGRGRRE